MSRSLKKGAKYTKAATSHGVSAAQLLADASSSKTIGALVAGTAVGATGVGLLIGAGALTLATGAQAGRSVFKTNQHINNLKAIQLEAKSYACTKKSGNHSWVQDKALPYIIAKKRSKLHRKAFVASSLGVFSFVESGRAATKKAYKYLWSGNLGRSRHIHATWLAHHFLECDFELSNEIVSELYSEEKKDIMKGLKEPAVIELLKDKMKSV